MDYHHFTRKCDGMCDSCDCPAEVRLTPDSPEQWRPMATAPHDGTSVQLLIYHLNRKFAWEGGKRQWEQIVEAAWIDFNGGGWTWRGMCGEPQGWRPVAAARP